MELRFHEHIMATGCDSETRPGAPGNPSVKQSSGTGRPVGGRCTPEAFWACLLERPSSSTVRKHLSTRRVRVPKINNMNLVHWDSYNVKARSRLKRTLLRDYLNHDVYPYSQYYRELIDNAGIDPLTVREVADFAQLPPTTLATVQSQPWKFVLRPDEDTIAQFGDRRLLRQAVWARVRGKGGEFNREVIDPSYKPVQWVLAGGLPIGSSQQDVDRLADTGERALAVAGLTRDDVLLNLTTPDPNLAYVQISCGALHSGISSLSLSTEFNPDLISAAAPSVVAGPARVVYEVLSQMAAARRPLPELRRVIVLGTVLGNDARSTLANLAYSVSHNQVEVLAMWSPKGARALWAECDARSGFHTYPDLEWVASLPGGPKASALMWTSLAWHGTALMWLETGLYAHIEEQDCPNCGRSVPRVFPSATPLKTNALASQGELPRG